MSRWVAGRAQMGTSLAFHLSFAVCGVGLPVMMFIAEGLHRVWLALARRWSEAHNQRAELAAFEGRFDVAIALAVRARPLGHQRTRPSQRPGARPGR